MYHSHHYPRTRLSSRHRKRIAILIGAVVLSIVIGYKTGATVQAIHAETIQSELRDEVQDLRDELIYYRNRPATGRTI